MFMTRFRVIGSAIKRIIGGDTSLRNFKIMENFSNRKSLTYSVTQNITLNAVKPIDFSGNVNSIPVVNEQSPRPMIVLLEYMNAQKKHVKKIVDVYLDQGFDVLQIGLKPLQLLYPPRGSQVVARDIAEFLLANNSFTPLILHGFSVGGYLWSETLVHFENDTTRYQPVIDRIIGQIFDSPADIDAIPTAFPSSLFPNNALIRSSFQAYLRFHLKVCHNLSTKHYIKARQAFTKGLIKAPMLCITSNADVLSSPESVFKVRDEVLEKNLECTVKVFDGSKHVMHFKTYPNEYLSEIQNFLTRIGRFDQIKLKAKL